MATPAWQVQGQYHENCSCDYVCPCVLHQLNVQPSKGSCTFAMGFDIERGRYGDVKLDGLGFVVLGFTPAAMANGNWSVGLVIDERATAEQRDAIASIASGSAGGPMAALGGLIGKFLGVETARIEFKRDGKSWSLKAGEKVRIQGQPAYGLNPESAPLQLSNTGHPAADSFTLARTSD
ncbi:MAG TPA: DUF1326 domain-containing protein, partial [Casimicrobiaceae bacterium]|nr:DUF1326 domain-containing protein [Casimicrobiaceae bacterium]